jgi:hypothetical protein
MVLTGQKLLWALDIDGFLSIGDPSSNKHSVVAVGKNVKGAGIAQLKLDPRMDEYLAMRDQAARATEFEGRAAAIRDNERDRELLLENAAALRGMAESIRKALGDWMPPATVDRTIELDFDSGHYAPRGAWIASTEAWNAAGYRVVWSTTCRYS